MEDHDFLHKSTMKERRCESFAHSTLQEKKILMTPPSKQTKIKNPFEAFLMEKLHTHFFSPSVFSKISTPKSNQSFKWDIDELSQLKPADVEEHLNSQFEAPDNDSALDEIAQSKIDTFFSLKEIVPSPQVIVEKNSVFTRLPQDSPPSKVFAVDNSAQTVLTLPPNLPPELDEALRPYFTFTENQQCNPLDNNVLYRKLFDFETERSLASSSPKSVNLELSPLAIEMNIKNSERLYSPLTSNEKNCALSMLMLSPVIGKMKSSSKLDVSVRCNMSVDGSFQDICMKSAVQLFQTDDDEVQNPSTKLKNFSSLFWDADNKAASLSQASFNTSSSNEMDVSNSNTPRRCRLSRSASASNLQPRQQPKKLSDSFRLELTSTELYQQDSNYTEEWINKTSMNELLENHNQCETNINVNSGNEIQKLKGCETLDLGYHTQSSTFSDDSCTTFSLSRNIVASTPTTLKHF